jgi:dimethylglycine dehydrogenase
MNYHVTGSVRLGHSKERLQEFKRVVGMGRYQGMDLDILARRRSRRAIPLSRPMT